MKLTTPSPGLAPGHVRAREVGFQDLLTTVKLTYSTAPAPAAAIRLAGGLANYKWSRIDPAGQLRALNTTYQNGRGEATLDEPLPSLGCTFLLGRRAG